MKQMSKEEEIKKVKEIIKERYEDGNCGLYDTRNNIGDEMTNIFSGEYISLDYCYDYSYFEVFGLTDREFMLLKEYYNNIKELKLIETISRQNRYINQLRFERDLLQGIVDKEDIPEEMKILLNKIHDDTCLVEKINKAIDKLICWGELLDADFQKEMLEILGYEEKK